MQDPSKTNKALITENALLKERIQELEKSELILKATQKLTKVGGWSWDVVKQTMTWTEESYRIHDFNPVEILPGSAEHIERSLECYRPEDRPIVQTVFQRCVDYGEPYDLEFPFTTAKGRKIWIRTVAEAVMDRGQVLKVIGNIMDITDRKHAEEALRESEKQFRAIANYTPDLENWVGPDGKLLWVNPMVFDFTGYSVEECMNMYDYPAPLLHEEDRERMMRTFESSVNGSILKNVEFRIRCKDGSIKWAGVSSQPIYDENGMNLGHHASIRDITSRKLAEEALRNSEERFRQLADATFEGILIHEKGVILDVNQSLLRVSGYDYEELIGQDLIAFVAPESRKVLLRRAESNVDTPSEISVTKKDGTNLIVEVLGKNITYEGKKARVVAIRDITERKQMEEALRESEERFRSFMDNSPTIAWMKDEQGRHVYLSKTYEDRFGVKQADWQGKTDFELWPREVAEEFWKNDQIVFNSGQSIDIMEKTPDANGGTVYWWNFKFLCKDMKGRKYVGGVGVDITSRKKAEEELIKHREHLETLVKDRTAELENKRASLEELNTALKILLRQREKDKDELEEKVLANIKELVMPYIQRLKKSPLNNKEANYVDILESNLMNIISPFSNKLSSKYLNLTPTEIQVANLIKEGKTTKEIAEMLNISPGTVEFHRRNIRIKFNLKSKKDNLRTYLLTLS
jgi:PAS domain S-box-containing protein